MTEFQLVSVRHVSIPSSCSYTPTVQHEIKGFDSQHLHECRTQIWPRAMCKYIFIPTTSYSFGVGLSSFQKWLHLFFSWHLINSVMLVESKLDTQSSVLSRCFDILTLHHHIQKNFELFCSLGSGVSFPWEQSRQKSETDHTLPSKYKR